MVITLPKEKKQIIGDLLEKFDVTAYMSCLAKGSKDQVFTKEVMFCIIKEDQIKDAMLALEDKIAKLRIGEKSMTYVIPLSSIIGASNYIALSNGGKE